jgi:hypothetical protein
VGSNPTLSAIQSVYSPDRSFTERSEDILYTFGPKGLFKGCRVFTDEALIGKMIHIARALGAKVQGDDGEIYPAESQSFLGRLKNKLRGLPPDRR